MRMPLPILVLGLVLGTSAAVQAQGAGVIVGVNFANLEVTPADTQTFDRRTGLVGGVFVNMPLGSSFSIQPEFLYSQKGAKFKDGSAEATVEIDYLDIPVLARITAGGTSGLVLFAGPSFGYKLRAHSKITLAGDTEDQDITNDVESFDWGIIAGGGIQSTKYLLDARYQWGRTNINKDEFDASEVKNRVFSIVLGIRF